MNAWRIFRRTSRIIEERRMATLEKQLERDQARANKTKVNTLPQIVGKLFEFLLNFYLSDIHV